MDAWMRQPGARVEGHAAVVRGTRERMRVECGCGFRSSWRESVEQACQSLVTHLVRAVDGGAAGLPPGDDGSAGVREPRRPTPSGQPTSATRRAG